MEVQQQVIKEYKKLTRVNHSACYHVDRMSQFKLTKDCCNVKSSQSARYAMRPKPSTDNFNIFQFQTTFQNDSSAFVTLTLLT